MDQDYTLPQIIEQYDHVLIDNNVLTAVPGMRYLYKDLRRVKTAEDLLPLHERLEDHLGRAEDLQQLLSAENVHTTVGVLLEHLRFYNMLSKKSTELFEKVTGHHPEKGVKKKNSKRYQEKK